jgi:hypothetical protein
MACKKLLNIKGLAVACILGVAFNVGSVYGAQGAITVAVDGETVAFSGQAPVIVNGRTLIPLRGVFEKMGYSIEWDGATKTATLKTDKNSISVSANSSAFTVNGESKALDVPAQIMNGSMMLPLRAIGESAGANVVWNGETKTVSINTGALSAEDIVKASDYHVNYAKVVAPLDDVQALYTELASLDGEITAPELQSYRVRLYNAQQTIASVKAEMEKISVPDSMSELHALRLESVDKLNECVQMLLDFCDGNTTEEETTTKFKQFAVEVDEINKKVTTIIEKLEN